MSSWRRLWQRYRSRDVWPWWLVFLGGVAINSRNIIAFLGDLEFLVQHWGWIITVGNYLSWVDDVAFHPAAGIGLLLIGLAGLLIFGRTHPSIEKPPTQKQMASTA